MSRVLVVDDEKTSQKLHASALKEIAKCDIAGNGLEAFRAYNKSMAENDPYDLMLLDIEMPHVDGVTLVKLIRENEDYFKTPKAKRLKVLIISGHETLIQEAVDLGCKDYFVKPINAKKLQEKVYKMLDKGTKK